MNGFRAAAAFLCAVGSLFGANPAAGAESAANVPSAAGVPQGLSASDWSSIRAAYEAGRHAAFPVEGGWQARNPGQQWRMRFDGRGFVVTPDLPLTGEQTVKGAGVVQDGSAGWPLTRGQTQSFEPQADERSSSPRVKGWSWGLELTAFGRGGQERALADAPACIEASGGRVEYRWDETLTEWYINDQRGLEHGYTVHRRPESSALRAGGKRGPCSPEAEASGNDRAPSGRHEPLQFTLAVRGGLCPNVSIDGRSVTFINDAGAAIVNYAGLTVFDADGVALPAWFAESGKGLMLSVDDRGARYPLTIDPVAHQAYVKASNTGASDQFGISVAVSGDTVVVGAYAEDSNATGVNGNQADNSANFAGAAYVFVRSGGVWSQQAYLKASNTGAGDQFGASVAVSGDTLVVGAVFEDSSATDVDGNQANNSAGESGAAYVFVRDAGGVWSQQAYLKASNTGASDQFGISVAVSGDTVVVGAHEEDSSATGVNGNQADNSAADSGAAYVFVRSGGVWSQQAYLKASNTEAIDSFSYSVAVSGDTVVVGAWLEDSSATGVNGNGANNSAGSSGAAYVFVRSGGVWSQQAYLKASNTGANDFFGFSVAVSGDTVVVGAWSEDSNATGVNGNQADNSAPDSGAAYVFVCSGGVWSQQAYLKASNTGAGDVFGFPVAVSGDTVVVGAFQEDSSATGVNGNQANNSAGNSGAAYVFVRDAGGVWSQQAYLKASNTGAGDEFGYSVAASGDTVVVGAIGESSSATGVNGNQADNSAGFSGAAYVFTGVGPSDADGDGVPDGDDDCPGTPMGEVVNADGCSCSQIDPCDDLNPCTDDSCTAGECSYVNNSAGCDDGLFCTTGETCSAGMCIDGSPTDCSAEDDQCNVGVCNESTDMCEPQPANEGGACDDGDVCTSPDSCLAGTCSGTALPDNDADGLCDDIDPDDDNDGVADGADNCPLTANADQADRDNDGFGDVCDPPACPDCPANTLYLELADIDCAVDVGDIIQVKLWMLNLNTQVSGFLAFLSFDDDLLMYRADLSSYTATPFPIHVGTIAAALTGPGQLDLNGSAGPNDRGTSSDSLLATLKFEVIAACQTTSVDFRTSGPFESELSVQGDPIVTATQGTPDFAIDNITPGVTAPDDVTVQAVPGGCTATVDPGMATGSDNCPVTITGVRSDGEPLGAPYPSGMTTITWTATDACGHSASDTQTVTVLAENHVVATVVLAGVDASDWPAPPLVRCIKLVPRTGTTCGTALHVPVTFSGNPATGTAVFDPPCGPWTSLCAKDEQHTLFDTQALVPVGSQFETPTALTLRAGDNDNDSDVDINDLTFLMFTFGNLATSGGCPWSPAVGDADFANSGATGSDDFSLLSDNWLTFSSCLCTMPVSGGADRRASIPTRELRREVAARVDKNRDGVFDAADVEAFEREHGLPNVLSQRMKR